MKIELYLSKDGEDWKGPYSPAELKVLAEQGEVEPTSLVRKYEDGKPIEASKVKGLFPPPSPTVLALAKVKPAGLTLVRTAATVGQRIGGGLAVAGKTLVVPVNRMLAPREVETVFVMKCPYCGETVLQSATLCRYCDKPIHEKPPAPPIQQPAPGWYPHPQMMMPQMIINNSSYANAVNGNGMVKRWSRIVAAILSLIIPGAGQLYKGQAFNGLAWFVVVIVGYVIFIVPGVFLHICCVLGAFTGDPYR
jgi:TM2 domain-containing membrane protein YozV/predicted RNA-binding Zn-ribbon protein involved in translation (DUF1610 family)